MSANDILDVLDMQREHSSQAPAKKKQKVEHKKQTGIQRELYNLLGPSTPPVQLSQTTKFKERLNAISKPTPWTWTDFKNNSRSDGLRLFHWIKGASGLVQDAPYAFEKYNTKLDIPDINEEKFNEYMKQELEKVENARDVSEQFLETENEEENSEKNDKDTNQEYLRSWSYEETAYLFDLVRTFDARWHIIIDRYDFSSANGARSQEDLKEHFYKISSFILSKKVEDETKATPQLKQILSTLQSFNKTKEVERKQYLERLLLRSPAEIAEEESLVIEARRFEMAAKKMMTERAQLLQLLDSPQATGSIQQYQSSQGLAQLYNTLMISDKSKKRKIETPVPPVIPPAASSSIKKEKVFTSELQSYLHTKKPTDPNSPIAQLIAKRLSPKEEEAFGLSYHPEKLVPGATLRTSKLPTFRPTVQTKILGLLNELGVPAKPVMPTEKTCEKFEELLKAINILLECKRQTDKLEAELKMVKGQKGEE